MRICVFNWLDRGNPLAGGAELHLHETFGRLAAAGHDVTLVSSGWGAGEPSDTVLDGIRVLRCGRRLTYPLFVKGAYRLAGGVDSFDIVVEDLNKTPLYTPRWVGVPVVLLVHHLFGTTAFQEASFPIALATWALERPIGRVYQGVPTVVVSESTADDLVARGLERSDIAVIHNGVDVAQFAPAPKRAHVPTLLYLGRLKRYKRVDVVIKALSILRLRGHDVRLRVAGTGDRLGALESLATSLEMTPYVDFLGFVTESEKAQELGEAWVHVFMSEKEGWGLTTIEAGASGTPTVAADAPGLRDSVRNGETGILVPPGDPNALADALEPFVLDLRRVDEVGSRAKAFAETLTWDRTAERMAGFLAEVLAGRNP